MKKKVGYNLEYIDITKTVISVDPECDAVTSTLVNAQSPLVQSLLPMNPPVAKATRDGYVVIARAWAYQIQLGKESKIAFLVADTNVDVQELRQADKHDFGAMELYFKTHPNLLNPPSRTTLDRQLRRKNGRICPRCGAPLRQPRAKKDRTNEHGFIASCEKAAKEESKRDQQRCNFQMTLTGHEADLFREGKLDILTILSPTELKCAKCDDAFMYQRAIWKDATTCVKLLRCINYYVNIGDPCTYNQKVLEQVHSGGSTNEQHTKTRG